MVKYGYCGVFEFCFKSLNGFLDPKNTEELLWNCAKYRVKIHPDFLFVSNCSLEQNENLSPGFLNRFTVINLEDQLKWAWEKEEMPTIKYTIEQKM